MKKYIPIYKPSFTGKERQNVMDCFDSSWISSKGKYLKKFEKSFAHWTKIKYATSTNNGTSALHLCLLSLGIGKGDEIIIPSLTYVSSANVITFTGAKPVFADVEKDSWVMDIEDVKRKITSKTKAIVAVHLYGCPCDMLRLKKIAKEKGLYLIEDCAEAIGAKIDNQHVGNFGDISAFSFYGNKTITTGEGGMVVSNNKKLIERAFLFKMQGVSPNKEYWHTVIGYNYKMTNICAAIGVAQLENINFFAKRKTEIAEQYQELLSDLPLVFQKQQKNAAHSFWMVSFLVPKKSQRDLLRKFLEKNGIETRPLFYPVHTLPMYNNGLRFPVSEDISQRGIVLPSYPQLTNIEVQKICNYLHTFFKKRQQIEK